MSILDGFQLKSYIKGGKQTLENNNVDAFWHPHNCMLLVFLYDLMLYVIACHKSINDGDGTCLGNFVYTG